MKVSFPYMGTTVIYKKLLELLGHEVIMPPKPSQRTINLGVKYSPEFACFPLKVIMGSYMEAVEKGAEAIITSGGHGPCRAGFYERVHSRILEEEDYNVEFIVFDSMFRDYKKFFLNVLKVKGSSSWYRLGKSFKLVYTMLKKMDILEKQVQVIRAYELKKGETTKVWEKIQDIFDKAYSSKEIEEAFIQGKALLDGIKQINRIEEKRIRIGIVGEIYVVMEASINMKIEELLGSLGAEVERSQYLTQWINYNALPKFINRTHEIEILKKGERYIPIQIGGHAKQTVGHIVDFSERGFDGVIHLMPFGCLPELISQSIVPKITEDFGIPVLTLSIDEQAGTANNLTRIEAFLDLIKGKKMKKIS
ncbi:Predicted nucleotide-binding protein, sugar kinase/HSP70/actin superfamily [Natronincola peptidivorans]|uniref:Predicted nucleotide-binding protein, sugar kinase/HSP70/actin superfamily n=1 Tax=Natronincola peptidivorans TaxID=426128 RepID=A0A1I0GAE2_9FIRM|nr:2-hydroxyacyl-CoA dehydratase [Natronincola peptidivorans]SET68007.1 Predicted nucleotide-binding protein, sugar kinase/HSP70/actin superfamily [Natronincola peptidivorans]